MSTKADLHIHSLFSSDGEWTTPAIIKACESAGVKVFSITDHNTVKGAAELYDFSDDDLIFIPGIEIDCVYRDIDLHLLGYHINCQSSDFATLENEINSKVLSSFSETIHKLHALDLPVDAGEVLQKANGKLPTGELIAEVVLGNPDYDDIKALDPYRAGGSRSDMPYLNFYLDYCTQGKPAYVRIELMDFNTARELIEDNGGIPVIAHPGLNFKGKEEWVEGLLQKGARGVEVFNNYHDDRQMDFFAQMSKRENNLLTCGSDFHGKIKPGIKIGEYHIISSYEPYLEKSLQQLIHRR